MVRRPRVCHRSNRDAAVACLLLVCTSLARGAGAGGCGRHAEDCTVLFDGITLPPPPRPPPHPDRDPDLYAHGHVPPGREQRGEAGSRYVCFRNPALVALGWGVAVLFVEGRRVGCGDFDGPHEILSRTSLDE